MYGAGIGCLREGLQVEAVCKDGQIEAVSVKGAKAFAVGVQWHPEYRYWEKADYSALIGAFHWAAEGVSES